jgi:hypothetical protein
MNVEPVLNIGKTVSDVFQRYGSMWESVLEYSAPNAYPEEFSWCPRRNPMTPR